MNSQFIKIHTIKVLAISGIVLAAGAGLFFIKKDLGAVIFGCGILLLILFKSGYKHKGSNVVLKHKMQDLSKSCRNSLIDFLSGKDIDPEIKPGNEGGTILLEVWYNKQEGITYAQLSDFSNYTYVKATELVELHSPKSDKLISKLQ